MKTKVIAVIGDSHTWGQGVDAESVFTDGIVGGEKRMMPFSAPFYVNLLRNEVTKDGKSTEKEYYDAALSAFSGDLAGGYAEIREKSREVTETFSLLRFFFRAYEEPTKADLLIDGKTVKTVSLPATTANTSSSVIPVSVFAEDRGLHTVCIKCRSEAPVLLHRAEFYDGEYAVVNCGIGSCTVQHYEEEYLSSYIEPLTPSIILFEGCTVNNWIIDTDPEQYREALRSMQKRLKALAPTVLWHTVFPVGGEQHYDGRPCCYDDYAAVMKEVAAEYGVPYADCGAAALRAFGENDRASCAPRFFHDAWHPSKEGHALYASEIIPLLKKYL